MVKRSGRSLATAVAVAALLPLTAGGARAAADPVPPGREEAGGAVPLDGLVPGVPPGPHEQHIDTPDQALPPVVPQAGTPSGREEGGNGPNGQDTSGNPPPAAPPAASAPAAPPAPPAPAPSAPSSPPAAVEFVPPAEAQAGPADSPPVTCSSSTGPYQREVERFLGLTVDGKQSREDCRAIRAWQVKEEIVPAIGFAGPTSWGMVRLSEARRDPNASGACPVRAARVACVDLPRQLMWVQHGADVVFGPVPIRSGMAGFPTRVGWNAVYLRSKDHVSTLYDSPMPFAQFFNGGQAFHGVYGNIYDPNGGSHGCVNLRYDDAKELWNVLFARDRVYSWGRRPGT
ncbi:L,D-transpeptidase [Streptomyces sp. NPDC047108]|uniref:L,D-transpeptidase n=1 Tax=Streptomyces sp. NPDC047108 TaxID=3155025 RepID=UPI0033DF78C1